MQASGVALSSAPVPLLPCLQDCGVTQDDAAYVTAAQPHLGPESTICCCLCRLVQQAEWSMAALLELCDTQH